MKKKDYIRPNMVVVKLRNSQILCASSLQMRSGSSAEEDYYDSSDDELL